MSNDVLVVGDLQGSERSEYMLPSFSVREFLKDPYLTVNWQSIRSSANAIAHVSTNTTSAFGITNPTTATGVVRGPAGYTVVGTALPKDIRVTFTESIEAVKEDGPKPTVAPYSPLGRPFVRQEAAITPVALPVIDVDSMRSPESLTTAVIQIWEGNVLSVDKDAGAMDVKLSAKIGNAPDHSAEISLQWVASQDADLVKPGAIFYWTLYKETKRGTIRNSQELRFRRLPSWSKIQLARIKSDAKQLAKKIKKARVAD